MAEKKEFAANFYEREAIEHAQTKILQHRSDEIRMVLNALRSFIPLMLEATDDNSVKSGIAEASRILGELSQLSGVVVDAMLSDHMGLWLKLLVFAQSRSTVLPAPVRQYGGLIVTIASAQNSSEVRDALVAAAAPLGTWRSRYTRGTSLVTVGGSVGIGFQASNSELLPSRPISVPFGVEVKLGTPVENLLSLSGFVQILDLAGWLNLQNGVQAPRVLQGLSPGLAVKLGLFGAPISLSAGASWDIDTGEEAFRQGMRYSVMLTVDAPLFVAYRR